MSALELHATGAVWRACRLNFSFVEQFQGLYRNELLGLYGRHWLAVCERM
jgi:hypothetical protein